MIQLPKITSLIDVPSDSKGETIEDIIKAPGFCLEHIVSRGEASKPQCWYDQERPEWVMLVKGTAALEFEHGEILQLVAGDSLTIPACVKHRVAEVSEDAIWIALHYQGQRDVI